MKSAILALGTVCALTAWTEEISFDRPAIVPMPVRMTFESNVVVRLNRETHLVVTCPDATAGKWVADHVERWFGFRPTLSTVLSAPDGVKGDEGYALLARPGRIALGANTLQGVRYALMALRQAAQRETIGMTLAGYWLPACEINDAPALTFRGLHVCWFPETSPALVERLIRLAGYYRLNAVVLENWGVFRSERHPWWGCRDGRMTKAEIARLRAIADASAYCSCRSSTSSDMRR